MVQIASILDVTPDTIENFSEQVAFHNCHQSGYINSNYNNPLEKIEALYTQLLEEKERQIKLLEEEIQYLKKTL